MRAGGPRVRTGGGNRARSFSFFQKRPFSSFSWDPPLLYSPLPTPSSFQPKHTFLALEPQLPARDDQWYLRLSQQPRSRPVSSWATTRAKEAGCASPCTARGRHL